MRNKHHNYIQKKKKKLRRVSWTHSSTIQTMCTVQYGCHLKLVWPFKRGTGAARFFFCTKTFASNRRTYVASHRLVSCLGNSTIRNNQKSTQSKDPLILLLHPPSPLLPLHNIIPSSISTETFWNTLLHQCNNFPSIAISFPIYCNFPSIAIS